MANKDYRALTEELDGLISTLQASDIDIEEAVKSYERGMQVIGKIELILKAAENKVTKVTAAHTETE